MVPWEYTGADDRPFAMPESAELINVSGEMGPMKTADTDVDDARSKLVAGIARSGDSWPELVENSRGEREGWVAW